MQKAGDLTVAEMKNWEENSRNYIRLLIYVTLTKTGVGNRKHYYCRALLSCIIFHGSQQINCEIGHTEYYINWKITDPFRQN